jgi:hypothetical protein
VVLAESIPTATVSVLVVESVIVAARLILVLVISSVVVIVVSRSFMSHGLVSQAFMSNDSFVMRSLMNGVLFCALVGPLLTMPLGMALVMLSVIGHSVITAIDVSMMALSLVTVLGVMHSGNLSLPGLLMVTVLVVVALLGVGNSGNKCDRIFLHFQCIF